MNSATDTPLTRARAVLFDLLERTDAPISVVVKAVERVRRLEQEARA